MKEELSMIVDSAYGLYLDVREGPAKSPYTVKEGGENLAAKILYPDRVVKIGWDGSMTTEAYDEARK